jgi:hypothetical protein
MAKNKIPGPRDSEYGMCRSWSLGNPRGKHASNLPMLLRRVADQMEHDGMKPMEILDLSVHQEMTAKGPWWSVTVYWAPNEEG